MLNASLATGSLPIVNSILMKSLSFAVIAVEKPFYLRVK
jgi:hypothetical protein